MTVIRFNSLRMKEENYGKASGRTESYDSAVWLSPSWQAGWLTDFGPVDDSLLVGLHPYKDASTSSEVYQEALRKHRVSPKSK